MRSGQCNHRWMKRSVWTLSEIDLIWLGCREKTCDLLICAVFFALIFARFHDGSQETSRFCPSSGSYWWTRDCRQAHACAMDFRASVWKTWQHDTMIPSCCILCWLKDPVNCGRSLLVEAPTLQELNLSFEDLDKPLLLSRDHGSELSEVDQENASAEFCCTWPRSTWVFFLDSTIYIPWRGMIARCQPMGTQAIHCQHKRTTGRRYFKLLQRDGFNLQRIVSGTRELSMTQFTCLSRYQGVLNRCFFHRRSPSSHSALRKHPHLPGSSSWCRCTCPGTEIHSVGNS